MEHTQNDVLRRTSDFGDCSGLFKDVARENKPVKYPNQETDL